MFARSLQNTYTSLFKLAVGVILLFACSQLTIPMQPVPITLQTVAVMLIGLTFSPTEAMRTVGTFLVLGAVGLPVFAGFNSGVVYMFGKTGGYLFGFLLAAVTMAHLQYKAPKTILNTVLTCLVGLGVLYTCGVLWLSTFVGLKPAFAHGLAPFVLGELVKATLLSGALVSINYFRRG